MGTQTTSVQDYLYGSKKATNYIEVTENNITVSGGSFEIPFPSVRYKYADATRGTAKVGHITTDVYVGSLYIGRAQYAKADTALAQNTWLNVPRTSPSVAWSVNTTNLFNTENPTTKVLYLRAILPAPNLNSGSTAGSDYGSWELGSSVTLANIATITLNAPPTFDTTQVSFDTTYVYAGFTTASVTVSNCTAYYGGDISSATLTIGGQTVSISGDGTLSIPLNAGGTFTPTVVVTDSRGQTKTTTLDNITVSVYDKPSVSFTAERTLPKTGELTPIGKPDDEGESATITTTLTYTDGITTNHLVAPTVVVTDEDGNTYTSSDLTVNWYSSRDASTGALSGAVAWSSVASGGTVYGLVEITGGFNTQKSYTISVTPEDNIDTGTAISQTLATAFYTVDFLAGGHGIAFGQPASQDGFFCNMDANLLQGVDVTGNATITGTTETLDVYVDLPNYQTASTTDKAIYDALIALGWDSDVIV